MQTEKIVVKVKKIYEDASLPVRSSDQAAGYDLKAYSVDQDDIKFENNDFYQRITEDGGFRVMPGETVKVHTGLAIAIPDGYFGALYARSGLALKQGMRPANCTGVIDSDYRGEVIVALHVDGNQPVEIKMGDRVAQLIIQPYLPVAFETVQSLDNTERGEGGFGSTGMG